jgi:hypothetical protein
VDQVLYKDAERQKLYKKTRILIVTELVVTSLLLIPFQISHYYKYPKRSFLVYYTLLIEKVGEISVFFMVIKFTTVVLILRQRYKHVNKMFDFPSDIWREREKSSERNVLLLEDVQSCVMSSHTTKKGRRQILELRQIYSKLHDTVQLVNSYFVVPVLMFTFFMFMSVVHLLYLCVWMFGSALKVGQQPVEYIMYIGAFIWCGFCVLCVLIIGLSCQSTTEEYNNAQIVVEKLMLRCGLGCETVNELRLLSQQLNNMKISFTAGGFFTLDLPFVHSFVCVICTYVVIQAQFQ